jgi:hypothetical protein
MDNESPTTGATPGGTDRPAQDVPVPGWQAAEDRGGLWADEPVGTPRLPDPVRNAAVRAVLIAAFTVIEAIVALLGTVSGTWIAGPALLSTIVSTVVTTWAVVDVWVTRQVWNQRSGVVSSPSSAARALRRERRRERRAARASDRSGHIGHDQRLISGA